MTAAKKSSASKSIKSKRSSKSSSKIRLRKHRKGRRSSSKKSKKGNFLSCCAKKRKIKRSSRGKRTVRSQRSNIVSKRGTGSKPKSVSTKSSKKSIKEIAKPSQADLKKSIQSRVAAADEKLKHKAPGADSSTKTIPPSQSKPSAELRPGQLPTPQTTSTQKTTTTNSSAQMASPAPTESMVTAPGSPAPLPSDSKGGPQQEAGGATPPAEKPSKESREVKFSEDSGPDEEDVEEKRKSVAYPSHKFFMTQYVKDECRVRRWVYEDSIPLSMGSNMKHMLKVANNQLSCLQIDKERRCDMLKDLNEISDILNPKF